MKNLLGLLFLLLSVGLAAQTSTGAKTKVLLLGTFHFDNPGLDVAQFQDADVLSAKRQKEIVAIVKQLKAFGPNMVFIESTPPRQGYFDSLLRAYKTGNFQLKSNEIYQLGFRLAKELDLPRLVCVDYRDADFPFDSLVKEMTAARQTELLLKVSKTIDSIEATHNRQLKELSIRDILVNSNSQEARQMGVGFYLELLQAGSRENHVGSYLVSEWWRRNMVIYGNILKQLTGREKRVLVIFGSGHTALLHEFMKYNERLELVEAGDVLTLRRAKDD